MTTLDYARALSERINEGEVTRVDDILAVIDDAVHEERERCCRLICAYCYAASQNGSHESARRMDYGWYHMSKGKDPVPVECRAAMIRVR